MVNNTYVFQHNNLTQCIRILRHATCDVQHHSLQFGYIIFCEMANILNHRTSINLYHLGNARTSTAVLQYYKKLLLSDTNFYMLHKDVQRYFTIREQIDKVKTPSLWIVTNHFLNLMSRTDIMTVLDSAYIQLKSQLRTVNLSLYNDKSVVTE